MAYNEELADRIRISLDGQEGVVERKMFGGVAFTIHGNMCCGVVNDNLMVRGGPDRLEASLALPHAPAHGFYGAAHEGVRVCRARGAQRRWRPLGMGRTRGNVRPVPPKEIDRFPAHNAISGCEPARSPFTPGGCLFYLTWQSVYRPFPGDDVRRQPEYGLSLA